MLIDLLELAGNNALRYDEQSLDRLAGLHGRTMTLVVKLPGKMGIQQVSVSPQPHGIEFSQTLEDSPDVTLTATLGALVKISRDGLDGANLDAGELEIKGDPIVGQRFAGVLADMDIDWEGLMAEYIGEVPASLLSTGLGKAKEIADDSRSVLKSHLTRLLQDDMNIIADKAAVDKYLDEVDIIRADTERLQARLKRVLNNS